MPSYRLYGLLVILFGLVIAVALEVGRRMPAPLETSLIALPNCVIPCTLGIVPGISDRADVTAVIERVGGYTSDQTTPTRSAFSLRDRAGSDLFFVVADFNFADGQRVGAFTVWRLVANADLGQLSDLLLAGYTPNRVIRSCEGVLPRQMAMTFAFEDRLSAFFLLRDGLNPQTPISLLEVRAPNIMYDTALGNLNCSVESRWQGFAALWRYFPGIP
ncbi:MAG: hypothetical protein CUN53_15985 [Phototrophicales bacterium]|nr:MAG: hypothetical protein CUN53_15985 [Phototrophicales bacterium]